MQTKIIETPCISICRQENGRCVGCGRTAEEVSNWYGYSDSKRSEIMERLDQEENDLFN